MATANTITSAILEDQLPDFVREEHGTFVQFLKSYYEFMEQDDIPVRIPMDIINPDTAVYSPINPYGGTFQVGEIIEQKADRDNPSLVTASAKIFAWNGNTTSQTAIVTTFGGSKSKFLKNVEIVGRRSGVKFNSTVDVGSLQAGATRASLDLPATKNINETLDRFVDFIKKEFGPSLPKALFSGIDTRKALVNIRDFYRSRGSEDSFKFIFRLLYGEDVSIYFPKDDMLRASSANYKNTTVIRTTIPLLDASTSGVPVTTENLIGRTIRGLLSKATATVESASEVIYNGFRFAELELSGISGTFSVSEHIRTTNLADGSVIQVKTLGLLTGVSIDDPGSNYKVGDRIAVSAGLLDVGKASGAIVEVATVNVATGSIESITIVEPGYDYTELPLLDASGPHNGPSGALRFSSEPLETIFLDDFSEYTDANSFFSESDNRGSQSNVGTTFSGPTNAYYYTAQLNPASLSSNSVLNFTTVPTTGLKGYWKMNSYHPTSIRINSLDGTFGDGNDPANTSFLGPRVGDVVYMADRTQPYAANTTRDNKNYSFTNPDIVGDRTGANTYNPDGYQGFQPVVFDESGHGHHAKVRTHSQAYDATGGTANLYSEHAFANAGIFGAGSGNSFGISHGEGGMTLMPHDDIRNDEQQTWVFWYNPWQTNLARDSAGVVINHTLNGTVGTEEYYPIMERGPADNGWSIKQDSSFSDSVYTADAITGYSNTLFSFTSGTWDNGNQVTDSYVANNSGLQSKISFGSVRSAGTIKVGAWNMIALTIDYDNSVGNIYFFNTTDGLRTANGFSITESATSNTHIGTWSQFNGDGIYDGSAVQIGAKSISANGDSLGTAESGVQFGTALYDEIRYYDKALNFEEIEKLFYNPGGRADKVLKGPWKPIADWQHPYYRGRDPSVEFVTDEADLTDPKLGLGERYLRIGDPGTSGLGWPHDGEGLAIMLNRNIEFDPTTRYKMSVRAKDGGLVEASNCYMGIIGISNTGTSFVSHTGADNLRGGSWIVQSPGGFPSVDGVTGVPDTGSLGPKWATYTAVYGGNTSHLGLDTSTSLFRHGHGGNTSQEGIRSEGTRTKTEYNWANPAKLHGSLSVEDRSTTYIRPIINVNYNQKDDSTLIDFVKIEQQKTAVLTAKLGAEITLAGEYIDDSGKIGTSPSNSWTSKYIQDSRYYQIYSYVIKSGLSLGIYRELVKKLVHPAGTTMFGSVDIQGFGSVATSAFSLTETFSGDIVDLFRPFEIGAESSLIEDYQSLPLAGLGVAYKTTFGLKGHPHDPFNLDLAHGSTPHGAGTDTVGSPGWIVWDESPLTSPFANSHYRFDQDALVHSNPDSTPTLWPYDTSIYPTSTSHTTVTQDSLIWHINGSRSLLVSPFQNDKIGARVGQHGKTTEFSGEILDLPEQADGYFQNGWNIQAVGTTQEYGILENQTHADDVGFTAPLDIDGGVYRYVRMKVRRIGPGGYGDESWLGVCQADTNPSSGGHTYPPTMWKVPSSNPGLSETNPAISFNHISANGVSQPSTLIIPEGASADAKSPWHILEWDMWRLGTLAPASAPEDVILPLNGGSAMWKNADTETGSSPQTGGTGRRIGTMSFHLCYEPDTSQQSTGERFEIEWIQVDDGTGWARGSYSIPAGYVSTTDVETLSLGSGTGGMGSYHKVRVAETSDTSNRTLGDFSVAVETTVPYSSEMTTPPVIYAVSEKKISTDAGSIQRDYTYDANGAVFRVSANTANNLDWIVTEIIDSEKFLRTANTIAGVVDFGTEHSAYVGPSFTTSNGQFSGPVTISTDMNDNLYLGYLYEHLGTYPELTERDNSKPLMLFRATPSANVQTDMSELHDPYDVYSSAENRHGESNNRGRSNTFFAEQIMWGNVGGVDGVGVMVGGDPFVYNYIPAATLLTNYYGTGSYIRLVDSAGVALSTDTMIYSLALINAKLNSIA